MNYDVVIIGGGIIGLATAKSLKKCHLVIDLTLVNLVLLKRPTCKSSLFGNGFLRIFSLPVIIFFTVDSS